MNYKYIEWISLIAQMVCMCWAMASFITKDVSMIAPVVLFGVTSIVFAIFSVGERLDKSGSK